MRVSTLPLLLLACAGCADRSLSAYEPQATSDSTDLDLLICLEEWVPLVFVGQPRRDNGSGLFGGSVSVPAAPMTPKERQDRMTEMAGGEMLSLDQVVRHRPACPGFRSLCALINSYWGSWERIIIIEEFPHHEAGKYSFVAAGLAKGRVRIVTNLWAYPIKDGHTVRWGWEGGTRLRRVTPEKAALLEAMGELDKADEALPERFLSFDNVGWPWYFLHDIHRDGRHFSFGMCGGLDWFEEAEKSKPVPDYVEAGKLMPGKANVLEAQGFADDSLEGRNVLRAGRTYASLLARVWDALLEHPDGFLGQYSREAAPKP